MTRRYPDRRRNTSRTLGVPKTRELQMNEPPLPDGRDSAAFPLIGAHEEEPEEVERVSSLIKTLAQPQTVHTERNQLSQELRRTGMAAP